jgi:preprotein translocase subunit SecD
VRRITVGLLGVTALMSGCTSSTPASTTFSVRPVLCYAAPFSPPAAALSVSGLPACGSAYQLTAANLNISTTTEGPTAAVGPDPAFAHIPSTPTSQEKQNSTVILPGTVAVFLPHVNGTAETRGTRLILGPAAITKLDLQRASAISYGPGAGWLVNVTFTSAGSRAWDQLVQMQFHAYIAVVVNGVVISAPLNEPSEPTFRSLSGRMQITGNFTQQSAQALAAELQP